MIGLADVVAVVFASVFVGVPYFESFSVAVPSLVLVILFGFMLDENTTPKRRSENHMPH